MLNAFCTTITPDYYSFVLALIRSLEKFGRFQFFVHISSGTKADFHPDVIPPRTTFLFNEDICNQGVGKRIFDNYANVHMDWFRWAMKPVIMHYILQEKKVKKVIFVDCDVYFFDNPKFLFSELTKARFLITPHWNSSDPSVDTKHFLMSYTNGLYNSGFVGASKNALDILSWWAKACEYFCIDDPFHGLYVDQIHLNLVPIYFEGVKIIKHKGCNVAWWNRYECRRTLGKNGEVLINNRFPVVFIHFTGRTIQCIQKGEDPLLSNYLKIYSLALMAVKSEKDLLSEQVNVIDQYRKSNTLHREKIKAVLKSKVEKQRTV